MNKFTSIENFHNIRKWAVHNEVTKDILYRGKVKLHGTNAGIVINPNGEIQAQSRNNIITPEKDNAGFAAWVFDRKIQTWLKHVSERISFHGKVTIFGEWCGKGIQSGVAISQLDRKIFAVFTIQFGNNDDPNSCVIVNPEKIEDFLDIKKIFPSSGSYNEVYVIPWATKSFYVNFVNNEKLKETVELVNGLVEDVEKCDPWVKSTFGIEGMGEGLVLYPYCEYDQFMSRSYFSDFTWKAKGEKHRVNKQKTAVQIDPEVLNSIQKFAKAFATEVRFEQAVSELQIEFEMKNMGQFLAWVNKDVQKECRDELIVSGLEWKQVSKAVTQFARDWYMQKVSEI